MGFAPLFPLEARRFPYFAPLRSRPKVFFRSGPRKWGDCRMKGNGRLALMIGAMVVLGFAAPSQGAVSAGNILAAPATVDNVYRQEMRVPCLARRHHAHKHQQREERHPHHDCQDRQSGHWKLCCPRPKPRWNPPTHPARPQIRRVSIALRHSQMKFTEFYSLGVC